MGWLRNHRRRKAAERLADERMREAGGDVDAALESSQSAIDRYAAGAKVSAPGKTGKSWLPLS